MLTHQVPGLPRSWVPLTLGEGTYYTAACPALSLFHWQAIASLAFFLIHTACMVVAFDGNASGDRARVLGPPAVHLVAALLVSSRSSRPKWRGI